MAISTEFPSEIPSKVSLADTLRVRSGVRHEVIILETSPRLLRKFFHQIFLQEFVRKF